MPWMTLSVLLDTRTQARDLRETKSRFKQGSFEIAREMTNRKESPRCN